MLKQLLSKWRTAAPRGNELDAYIAGGRRPWSRGYLNFRDRFIARHLGDDVFLAARAVDARLPKGYGEFLDERVVEYPWLLSRLQPGPGRLLDAGSTLNHAELLQHPHLADKTLTLATLAPESRCYWNLGVSYVFADLRCLPFRDNYFDEIVSISTLEHIGKDNTRHYTSDARYREDCPGDFLQAMMELQRVCRPGGRLLLTVPFGRFTDFGWYQQFDGPLLDQLVAAFAPARGRETFFRYADSGWQVSDRDSCVDCRGFDIHATRHMNPALEGDYDADFAAASRGIAAIELWKEPA